MCLLKTGNFTEEINFLKKRLNRRLELYREAVAIGRSGLK